MFVIFINAEWNFVLNLFLVTSKINFSACLVSGATVIVISIVSIIIIRGGASRISLVIIIISLICEGLVRKALNQRGLVINPLTLSIDNTVNLIVT